MLKNVEDLHNVKFIDFGLARAISSKKRAKSFCSGSPFFIAPEVFEGFVCLESDIWSLGVVMYTLLSGELLFGGNSKEEIAKNILNRDFNIFNDPLLT